jgi:hypothetical protein
MMKHKNNRGCLFNDIGDEDTTAVDNNNTVALSNELVMPLARAAFWQSYGLSTNSIATVARWMHACGFWCKKCESYYFVNARERPKTFKYRPVFMRQYLGYKIRAHCCFK